MTDLKKELKQVDLDLLIRYAVPEEHLEEACAVVETFRAHPVALRLLHAYYEELPEACEEMAADIRYVGAVRGTYLLVVRTPGDAYLYICSEEEALYLGGYQKGITDPTILDYFGYDTNEAFQKSLPHSVEELEPLIMPIHSSERQYCVSCCVAEGEYHILGCPVEQCPWCDAQLSRCNCRFDQLGVDEIDDEQLLETFADLLSAQGRIRFKRSENPSYPAGGADFGPDAWTGGRKEKE